MRSIERTMQIHSKSTMKRTKNKSIKIHVERVLKSGFLSNEESLLLKNTLELMKILSKIKRFLLNYNNNLKISINILFLIFVVFKIKLIFKGEVEKMNLFVKMKRLINVYQSFIF